MKKTFEKTDKKVLISIISIIIILSTFFAYKIQAVTIENEMMSTGSGLSNGEEGSTGNLYLEDLYNRYDIFCSSKGTSLPSINSGNKTVYTVESVNIANPMEAYILAEMINNTTGFSTDDIRFETDEAGNKIEFTDLEALEKAETINFDDKTIYVIETKETKNENGATSESDSGIGSEKLVMKDEDEKYYYITTGTNSGYGIYSYVQRAWWNTEAGNNGNEIPPNELSTEAEQFEAYMNQFGEYEVKEEEIIDENGDKKQIPVPQIEYIPNFNETNVSVSWNDDKQVYLIGPFSINYIEAASTSTGRPTIMFAGISGVELYTDASEEPVELGNGWEFLWQNRDLEDKAIYPHTNEEFYIKLDYKDLATKITNIKFKFKYMNAGGKYEKLQGRQYIPIEGGIREKIAQQLAGGLIGGRWYEEAELNWKSEIHSGRLKIVKKLVDNEGNLVTSFNEDDYFTFKVTIGNETEHIKVKPGSYATSNLYTWLDGEEPPQYSVEELPKEGYELVEIKNASGALQNEYKNGPIEVIATNRITNKGHLRIVKKLTEPAKKEQAFLINVNVSGTFSYQGNLYKEQTLLVPVTLIIPEGAREAEVSLRDFVWNKKDAPKYEVTEDTSFNTSYELESINPKNGTLKENQETSVTVINKKTEKNLKLHIIKTLENR